MYKRQELWLLLGATVATGILGLIDDASKVAHERSLGLTPKAKLIGQFLIAAVFVLVAVNLQIGRASCRERVYVLV